MRRAKSLRIGVHNANAVVWGPVCGTHLMRVDRSDDVRLRGTNGRARPEESIGPAAESDATPRSVNVAGAVAEGARGG